MSFNLLVCVETALRDVLLDDQYAQYLSPAFVLSGTVPSSTPTFQDMSPAELDAYLSELEPDIRSAERDMSKIETLVKSKDVLSAGKLGGKHHIQSTSSRSCLLIFKLS